MGEVSRFFISERDATGSAVPMGKRGRAQKKVEARVKAIEAVRGILEGNSYQAVAAKLGYANRGTVHRIVQQALARHEAEVVDELRVLELARLDHIQAAFYPAATAGDVKSAEVVLKLMAARCRLLQLDRPPSPSRVLVITQSSWAGQGTSSRPRSGSGRTPTRPPIAEANNGANDSA